MSKDPALHRAAVKRWIAKNHAAGKCKRCSSPVVAGRKQCVRHLAYERTRAKKYYAASKADLANRYRARQELKICVTCGEASGGQRLCWAHRELNKQWQADRYRRHRAAKAAAGACLHCDAPPELGRLKCRAHLDLAGNMRRKSETKLGRVRNGRRWTRRPPKPVPVLAVVNVGRPKCACGLPTMTGSDRCWCCVREQAA
jgi:hypothetical protein